MTELHPIVVSPSTSTTDLPFLRGGGDMGALMRSIDWSRSPLGAAERWPQSLKTSVSICLASGFPVLLWWGPELVMLYNDAYRQIIGDKHPRSMGQQGRECWPEIWETIGPVLHGVLADGNTAYFEDLMLPLRRRGFSEECYFTFTYSPIRDETGEVGGVFCAVTETTQRVVGERQLMCLRELAAGSAGARSSEEAARSVEASLSRNSADLPFALLYLRDARRGTCALVAATGVRRGDPAVPESLDLLAPHPWRIDEVWRSQKPVVVTDGAPLLAPESTPRPQPSAAMVMPIAAGGEPGLSGVLVVGLNPMRPLDESYRGFLSLVAGQIAASIRNAGSREEERRRAEALAEIDRAKTAFFSNVSHEFRTPLTLILGPVEEALAGRAAGAGERPLLESIHRNALRLRKLVNSLLEFSRIEAGRARGAYRPVDLAERTRDAASTYQSLVERAGVRFRVECPPLDGAFFVDPSMWEQIVLNLVSNAFKHTFEGEIAVTLEPTREGARLTVSDTGTGIDAEHLPHLFERFYRVEGARGRSHEGSGIGLALVQELVRLHGGTIGVESRLGGGSRFAVEIPAGTRHLPPEHVTSTAEPVARSGELAGAFVEEALGWIGEVSPAPLAGDSAGPDASPIRGRVLVVDDNADMRAYLARVLAPVGEVDLARDGLEALASVHGQQPDVVVTDVMMPNLDGFGLLRALRSAPATREIPVVMLSARAVEEARVAGLEGGADDYVAKPFGSRELLARVRAQVALARSRQASAAERARIFALFEEAPVPICVLRGDELVFELANATYTALLGGRVLVGRSLAEAIPEATDQGYVQLLREVMRTGRPHVAREALLRVARGPHGSMEDTWWTFIYAPLVDPDGRVGRVMVFCNEVTEAVRARASLEEASRTKDEFLAMLGHELRNPLAPIQTAVQLMKLRGRSSSETDVIERQVRHLVRLVDDLLDVTRIARGKIQLDVRPVDLGDVIERAVEIASPLLEERRHELSLHVPRGVVVQLDPERGAQVFSNLLTNAGKYTEPGGRITIAAEVRDDRVVVSVRDNGSGIAPGLLPHIFDLFVQGRQHLDRARGGLGLGLSIVKNVIALHGGSVEASSAGPGQGSTFIVELPALVARTADASATTSRKPPQVDAACRVLVVDDNLDAAGTLGDALALHGCQTRVASDGPTALKVAAEFRPKVAFLDLGLPVMSGYDLARELAAICPGVTLVAVSGYGLEADRRRSAASGFVAHLVKPIDLDDAAMWLAPGGGFDDASPVA